MNHSSYKILITKSSQAASLISVGLREEAVRNGYISTGSGAVNQDCRIPALYHDNGYFYAYAEYPGNDNPKYELTIC